MDEMHSDGMGAAVIKWEEVQKNRMRRSQRNETLLVGWDILGAMRHEVLFEWDALSMMGCSRSNEMYSNGRRSTRTEKMHSGRMRTAIEMGRDGLILESKQVEIWSLILKCLLCPDYFSSASFTPRWSPGFSFLYLFKPIDIIGVYISQMSVLQEWYCSWSPRPTSE